MRNLASIQRIKDITPIPGADKIVPNVVKLTAQANSVNISAGEEVIEIICTMDWHIKDDPEFEQFPEHCVKGTDGANIIDGILLMELTGDIRYSHVVKKNVLSVWADE